MIDTKMFYIGVLLFLRMLLIIESIVLSFLMSMHSLLFSPKSMKIMSNLSLQLYLLSNRNSCSTFHHFHHLVSYLVLLVLFLCCESICDSSTHCSNKVTGDSCFLSPTKKVIRVIIIENPTCFAPFAPHKNFSAILMTFALIL